MPLALGHKLSALLNYLVTLDWVRFYTVSICHLYMDNIILTGEGFDTRWEMVSTEWRRT